MLFVNLKFNTSCLWTSHAEYFDEKWSIWEYLKFFSICERKEVTMSTMLRTFDFVYPNDQ